MFLVALPIRAYYRPSYYMGGFASRRWEKVLYYTICCNTRMALSEMVPIRFSPELLEGIDAARGPMGRGAWIRRLVSDALVAQEIVRGYAGGGTSHVGVPASNSGAAAVASLPGPLLPGGGEVEGENFVCDAYVPGRVSGVGEGRRDPDEGSQVEGGPPERLGGDEAVWGFSDGAKQPVSFQTTVRVGPAPKKSARAPGGTRGPLGPVVGGRPIVQKRAKGKK